MTRNETSYTSRNDHTLQNDCASLTDKRLVEELEDRYKSWCVKEIIKVVQAKEHRDREEPRGHESNGHSSHDCNGDHLLWPMHFFGHVSRTVKTGKRPVGIDKPNDECNAIGSPAGIIYEVGKNKFGFLMSWGLSRNNNEDHEEGHQGRVKGDCGGRREESPIAIETESKDVDQFISKEDVPRMNRTVLISRIQEIIWCKTYKSGCANCQQPTEALPTAKATLAEVKILPAQANHPVKYDAKLAYLFGASSFAQKYCPPAFGKALASSESDIPTQVEIKAIRMIP